MEQIDPIQLKNVTKSYIKTLPIWEHFDQFKTEIQLFEHDLKCYLETLNKRLERASRLPKLNINNRLKFSLEGSMNDLDIVRIYKKTNGTYACYEDKAKVEVSQKNQDPLIDESIQMLERKILAGEEVYALVKYEKPWVKCKVQCVYSRPKRDAINKPIITFRLKAPPELDSRRVDVDKYSIARIQNHSDKLQPTKRVIAGWTNSTMMPGIIGHEPTELNQYRYMVLMDDGSANYFHFNQIYPIFGQSPFPWLDAHFLGSKNTLNEAYLRHFFGAYPKRHIIKAPIGAEFELFRNGILVSAKIIDIDCDILRVLYKDNSEENIYRGSPRLLKKTDMISKQLASMKNIDHFFPKLICNMKRYYEVSRRVLDEDFHQWVEDFDKKVIISKNHGTARKSTSTHQKSPRKVRVKLDGESVDEDRKKIENLDNDRLRSHKCTHSCLNVPGLKTETSVSDIIEEFRNVSDLKVPLLLGWKRKLQRINSNTRSAKVKIVVTYEAPCGKIFQQPYSIRRHLINTESILDIDYFSFERDIVLNRELGDLHAYYFVENIAVDSKTGKPLENKNISLVNQCSEERLPQDFEYRNETFPHPMLKEKGFSFNLDFKSSCDCDDDCSQRSTCACHRLNEEFFGRNAHNRGSVENKCQYIHKRLPGQVTTGIFECNSWCSCSSKCSNRVVQNGIRFRLQIQKTLAKGWGVVTLDDIPTGAFICTYSAELLDDADLYGDSDMYYADLDYISVNETHKLQLYSDEEKSDEGVDDLEDSDEDDSPKPKQKGKRKNVPCIPESDFSEEENAVKNDAAINNDDAIKNDDDRYSISSLEKDGDLVCIKYLPEDAKSRTESRYPKRKNQQPQQKNTNDSSADSRARNRGRRARYRKLHDILDSHDFTLDARMQGNVGRFFNHSCDPNSNAQNVFIETHDLRFPVVAFFATKTIKAFEEITWNYNYKMGSIEGRVIYCHCGASNCKGRIL